MSRPVSGRGKVESMTSIKSQFRNVDRPLAGAVFGLVLIGVLSIYSAGVTNEGQSVSDEYIRQSVWALSGFVFMAAAILIDYRKVRDYTPIFYAAFLFILVLVAFLGRTVNGARSWLRVGDFGVQPSEFMKPATILFLARYLSEAEHTSSFRRLLVSSVIILIPVALILPQQDFGTALVFFPILLVMLLASDLDRRYLIFVCAWTLVVVAFVMLPLLDKYVFRNPSPAAHVFYQAPYDFAIMGVCALVAGLAVWGWFSYKRRYYYWIAFVASIFALGLLAATVAHHILRDYQMLRLIVFLDPNVDPQGSGWNIGQSVVAIGSGGFSGEGYLQGTQSHLHFLPEQSTDFIFSMVAEEWGFLGGFIVFALYFVVFWRCITLMKTTEDRYAYFVTAGILGMLMFHFMINTGMVMGIMPIMGIPLLLVSYGGSSMWMALLSIGILLGISSRRYSSY